MTAYTYDEHIVSDLHKDAYGYRPSMWFWEDWKQADEAGKQQIWDALLKDVDLAIAEERRRQEIAVGDFERGVRQNMALGASSRRDAIRWMLEGVDLSDHDLCYGADYVTYLFGLPWTAEYKAELDSICQEMLARRQNSVDTVAA